MDMILVLNDCSVKCYSNVKSKEGPILFQKLIAKSTCKVMLRATSFLNWLFLVVLTM